MTAPVLTRVAGALAEAAPLAEAALYDLVRVGHAGLLAEIIRLRGDVATLQVYEETQGLAVGEPVRAAGGSLELELGPGLLGAVLDGVGRPLARLAAHGDFLMPGADAPTLDHHAIWDFHARRAAGDTVAPGDVLGEVEERPGRRHLVLVPPGVGGTLGDIADGPATLDDAVAHLADGTPLRLAHRWPVRAARPVARRAGDDRPFVTGQRIFDLLFPVAEGGAVAVPGGFGTGKTIIEQSLAKHGDADVVVYVGCGERGNEMAEVLEEFPALADPRTGRPLMERTVLVVNTSNMPVAARESSVYVGMTIAEYYRDQGYRVALLTDSLSRWAEALRELGARLGEMPGEEGYPTYLASRLGQFFERACRARCLGTPEREGAVTLVAAISPPGGDLSEPVTQAALRVAGALWALDATLAHQRQFPAVDWATSWSLDAARTAAAFAADAGADWGALRRDVLALLQQGHDLQEIANLVGPDALQDADRVALESAALLRDAVLGQSAFDPHDARSPLPKTARLAALALRLHRGALAAVGAGRAVDTLPLAALRRSLAALRGAADEALAAAADALARELARVLPLPEDG